MKVFLNTGRKGKTVYACFFTGSKFGTDVIVGKYIILFMSLAFFGAGMGLISWVFVSILSPKHLIGLTGGVFNFMGNLASIIVPIVIGFLVKGGDFRPALVFIGAIALIGACSYIFLVGKIEDSVNTEIERNWYQPQNDKSYYFGGNYLLSLTSNVQFYFLKKLHFCLTDPCLQLHLQCLSNHQNRCLLVR